MKKASLFKTYKTQIKPYIKQIIILSFFSVLSALVALVFAYFSKDLIDEILNNNMDEFIFFAIFLSGLLFFNMIFSAVTSWFQIKFVNRATREIKTKYFNHMIRTGYMHRMNIHSGELMTHLQNDTELVGDGIISIVPKFIFYIARFAGAFILLLFIEPTFSLIFFLLGIILYLGSRIISPHMRKRHTLMQQAKDRERSFTQESLENIDVIQSFHAEQKMVDIQATRQKRINTTSLSRAKLTILSSSGMNLFFAFGYAFALIFGGYQLQQGLSVGYLVAIIQLIQHLQSPFTGLSLLYPRYQNTLSSIERLNRLYELPVEDSDQEVIIDFDHIVLDQVSFTYDYHEVLSNLSFSISKNQTVLIKGASGSGKTTLIKLLLGFVEPNEGSLKMINSHDDDIKISSHTRSLFSYVPQDNMLLSGSVKDNLNLFETYSDEALYKSLDDVSLLDVIEKHPLGLDMNLQEKGSGLSGGQIQRLAIARALLKKAPILLLDEVTSALDKETEMKLIDHLKELKNQTIIMITHHDLPSDMFDKIIFIE